MNRYATLRLELGSRMYCASRVVFQLEIATAGKVSRARLALPVACAFGQEWML